MLYGKFDGNMLTTFKVIAKRYLFDFLWAWCI